MSHFRFPVYLLGLPGAALSRLEAIVTWCVVNEGRSLIESDPVRAEEIFYQMGKTEVSPGSGKFHSKDSMNRLYRDGVVGRYLLGVKIVSLSNFESDWENADKWFRGRHAAYGAPSYVSLGSTLMWEEINAMRKDPSAGLGWRTFSILAAVNCALGDKSVPFVTTRDFIRAASAGLKSASGVFDGDGSPTSLGLTAIKSLF